MKPTLLPVICAVAGSTVALCAATNPSGVTLPEDQLWGVHAGTTFQDRCCDPINSCQVNEETELCSNVTDPEVCDSIARDAENPEFSNISGCNAGPTGTTCTEGNQTNICKLIYTCRYSPFFEKCERYQPIESKNAPNSCSDDCTT